VIALPAGTRIWIAAGVTDMRRGFHGLSARVQTVLEQQPLSGHVFVFRGRRRDILKVLLFDADGLCLLAKRLERGRFGWPQASSGTVSLSRAALLQRVETDRGIPGCGCISASGRLEFELLSDHCRCFGDCTSTNSESSYDDASLATDVLS
jgi:transposase